MHAHLLVWEPELESLTLTSTRALPEPLDALDATWGWFASGSQLLGRSNASQTAWLLQPDVRTDGPIDAYPYTASISAWEVGHALSDANDQMLLFSSNPSQVARVDALDFDGPGTTTGLEHPIDASEWGPVPASVFGSNSEASHVRLQRSHGTVVGFALRSCGSLRRPIESLAPGSSCEGSTSSS